MARARSVLWGRGVLCHRGHGQMQKAEVTLVILSIELEVSRLFHKDDMPLDHGHA